VSAINIASALSRPNSRCVGGSEKAVTARPQARTMERRARDQFYSGATYQSDFAP
jgi:hypothetical protein